MKIYISIIFVMLFIGASHAQNNNINFIISIDEKIPSSSLIIKYISYKDSDGKTYKYDNLKYVQGNLTISKEAFDKLTSKEAKEISLSLEYWEYCKDERKDYSYIIDLTNSHFTYEYLILHLFNLNKKEFRKIYFPIADNKNYTYYFDYPSIYKGRPIQRKFTKEQRKCN